MSKHVYIYIIKIFKVGDLKKNSGIYLYINAHMHSHPSYENYKLDFIKNQDEL